MTLKVVIVGGGFAGLGAAKALAGKKGVEVTLLDRRNHHLFQPLLYQVATAGLSPADIAAPLRAVLSKATNTRVLMDEVVSVDRGARVVLTEGARYPYDKLILATGAVHSYFGHEEWEDFAPGLKTLEQATEIRRRILTAFEEAEKESDPLLQKEWLTFVIVGGGPTGVELAGAISEISRTTLENDFRRIDPSSTRVMLIEAGPRLLAGFSEKLSKRAARDLEGMGVQIWTQTRVTDISVEGVRFGSEFIRARTVVWAAGVEASPLAKMAGAEVDRAGRALVQKDLSLAVDRDVFVIGDLANFRTEEGASLPGLAPVAMQQGRLAARNILADSAGRPREEFHYADKGMMATIGRRRAVAESKGLRFAGFPAWIAWLFVHIFYLIDFHNRVFVFLQWTWSYVTFKRGARLIASQNWRLRARRSSTTPRET